MAMKLLGLCLLLVLFCPSWAKKLKCLTSATNCDECLQSHPDCAWCTAPHSNIRCHTVKGLQRGGCHKSFIYNPQGGVQVVKNDSNTDPLSAMALFLQPQEISLHLRPGVSQSFPLTITMPTDQPITELNMETSPLPAGVNFTFSSVVNENPLTVQVNVEAARCPSENDNSNQMQNRTGPWSVNITASGFSQSVKLEITLDCQCGCMRSREEKSLSCSGGGALVRGQCECYESYVGEQSQREADPVSSPMDEFCRSGPNAPVCSDSGKCVDGFCECDNRVNPEEIYSGQYCECTNFNCLYHNNRICGGHGTCECGNCICDDGWTDDDCTCTMETASCMGNHGKLCNNNGICQCGVCKCEFPYAGRTCESCPTCRKPYME